MKRLCTYKTLINFYFCQQAISPTPINLLIIQLNDTTLLRTELVYFVEGVLPPSTYSSLGGRGGEGSRGGDNTTHMGTYTSVAWFVLILAQET